MASFANTISVIEGNGFTWEQVVYGEKQMFRPEV